MNRLGLKCRLLNILLVLLVVSILLGGKCFALGRSVVRKPERFIYMTLSYNLEIKGKKNTSFNLVSLIPQSIGGMQDVGVLTYNPEPDSVYLYNGNKYAEWTFKGKKMPKVVEVNCKIKLVKYKLDKNRRVDKLTLKQRKMFLRREDYLDVGKRSIKKAAKAIPNKQSDVEQAKEIAKFVIKTMDTTGATRTMLGAEKALKTKKGDCTEYADLLVTLARQKGLPAKHISGYIVTKATSVGHSWVDIYTKEKGWIRIDPLHIDLGKGTFEELENKYIVLSDVRNDSELGGGMLYSWRVDNGLGARVRVKVKVQDVKNF